MVLVLVAYMIAIVDYGMGNLQSVANAVEALGAAYVVTQRPKDLREANGIILPGVGAFGEGMENLRKFGLVDVLHSEVIERKKPYLGICLGLQFLAERGYEAGEHEGFGWIRGEVRLIEPRDPAAKIPHMGWNEIDIRRESHIFRGLQKNPVFYFVHSFGLMPDPADADVVTSVVHHGGEITASIQKGNIFATQFHPEKSQTAGLLVLKNFIDLTISHSSW